MARKRQIDPEYPFSDEIASLSINARYFYILSWCYMDDNNGVLPYEPRRLKLQIFPEDEIDVASLIDELIEQKRIFPFKYENKTWLWCPGFLKHQTIHHKSAQKCPNPPDELKSNYRSATVVLPQNRIEKNRVEKNRIEKRSEPSADFKEILERVYKEKGVNIMMLINKFKKDQRARKSTYEIPEEVYISVCKTILGLTEMPKCDYPYFMKILNLKAQEHVAQNNVSESRKYKRTEALADIHPADFVGEMK